MPTTVMVSLDGTEKDARALPVAAAVAGLAGGNIHLVHVIEAPSRRVSAESEFLGLDEDAVSGRREAETRVAATATGLSAEYPHRVTSSVLESDRAAEALICHASQRGVLVVVMATRAASSRGAHSSAASPTVWSASAPIDGIAMSTRGHGGLRRLMLGSVAEGVVRASEVPVLLLTPASLGSA